MGQKDYDGFKNTKLLWVENSTRSSSRYLEEVRVRRHFGNSRMEARYCLEINIDLKGLKVRTPGEMISYQVGELGHSFT
jgi:hypothetical protein